MKRCVVAFANSPRFQRGIRRIARDLAAQAFDGDFVPFDAYPPGCPPQERAGYGFKAFVIETVIERGYDLVLYVDASARFLRSPDPIFAEMERRGHFLASQRDALGEQCKDEVLEDFGLTRDQAMGLPAHMGSVAGVSRHSAVALDWLRQFRNKALDGYSLARAGGEHDAYWQARCPDRRMYGHRQQAVTSLIALQLGMRPFVDGLVSERPYDFERFRPSHVPPGTIIWIDRSIKQPLIRYWLLSASSRVQRAARDLARGRRPSRPETAGRS